MDLPRLSEPRRASRLTRLSRLPRLSWLSRISWPLFLLPLLVLAAGARAGGSGPHPPGAEAERGIGGSGEEDTDHPGALAHERYLQRVSGREAIPVDGLLRAREQIEAMRSRVRDAGLWTWTWLGPGNIGGRVRSILIHPTNPNRIWIGAVAGGIWTTTNGGSTWSPVDDFLPSLDVTSLAMDPSNFNILYASTGEGITSTNQGSFDLNYAAPPGAGIFKSTDGGFTWNQLASTNNLFFQYVNRLTHHPSAAGTLWAAASIGNIVWKSTNGGSSWTAPLICASPPSCIRFDPANNQRIIVGTGATQTSAGRVYLTTDGGSNWAEETTGAAGKLPNNGGRCEAAWAGNGFVYVLMDRNNGEIYRSIDGGNTWSLRRTLNIFNAGAGSQGWYDNVIWVDPANSNFVLAGGIDLWRSTDGGANFTQVSQWQSYRLGTSAHADQHWIAPSPFYDGTTNRTVFFANDGGIQKAADVSTVSLTSGWTNLANGLGITTFYAGACTPTGGAIIGGTQDSDVLRYTGGGTGAWYQAENGDGGACAVDFSNTSNMYSEYVRLQIEKSTNGGNSWFNSFSGLLDAQVGQALFIAPFDLDPGNSSTLVAGGYSLWKSTNGASGWSSVRGPRTGIPSCSVIRVSPLNSNEIWAGYTDGTISVSTNGGTSWTDVDDNGTTPVPERWVMDIAVSPYFAGEALVTLAGYNSDNVWVTEDRGSTWLRRTGAAPDTLPALQVNCVSYHPTNQDWIYIGTDLGMFASEDFGATWNVTPRYSQNDGPAYVEVDDLFWYGDEMVAATYGRGMFRSRPLDIVYVDATNTGFEDGSLAHPYNTVAEGIAACGNGTNLSVHAATYPEGTILFDRRGTVTATGGAVIVR